MLIPLKKRDEMLKLDISYLRDCGARGGRHFGLKTDESRLGRVFASPWGRGHLQSPGKKNMAEIAKESVEKLHPLVIFYDSEAAYGNVYHGDIIEFAAKCHPDVVKGSFQSLINTKQPLCAFGK